MARARVLTIAMLVVIALGVAATFGLIKTAQTPTRIPTSPAAGDAVDFEERPPSPIRAGAGLLIRAWAQKPGGSAGSGVSRGNPLV